MRLLRGEIEALCLENETQRRKNEALCLDIDHLRREIETLRSRQPAAVGAASAWEPFEALLQASPSVDVTGGDKLVMPAKYFLFGQTKAFMDGLPGMLTGGLLRSMAEEARDNELGKWLAEFEYVVNREAVEDVPDLTTTAKFKGKLSSSGNIIVRDHGHGGMTLADFCSHEMARAAELTVAEVAALRLYSGPMYAPLNYALRTENISDWATTIGCCYSGVLKLSFLSQPARVYRGVKEDEMQLPDEFLSREEGKFAGGVERAFMSTTTSAAVALDYSGGGAASGSIFVIDFDMNSRGASIQFLSQYPHEAELLFPPCTGLGCLDVSEHGRKRCVLVSAQVSTARLDTREVATPTHVPGTEAALQWAAEVLFEKSSVEEVISKEEWNLRRRNLSFDEHAERVALLLGRAATVAAPRVRSVRLERSQLSRAGGAAIGKAIKVNAVLTTLSIPGNSIRDEGAVAIAEALRVNVVMTTLDLGGNYIRAEGAAAISEALRGNGVLKELNLCANSIGPTGATALADALKVNGVLKSLNLCNSNIGPEGAKAIGKALEVNGVLTTLALPDNNIGAEGAAAIAEALRGNGVLTNLDVRRNEISGGAAQQLAIAVLASPSLELFGSVPLKELRANTLDQLDLWDKRLGVPEALVLAKLVEGSGVLTTLGIAENKIGNEGAVAIAEALRVNAVLTNLVLWENNIGDEGAKALAAALRVNVVLKALYIGGSDLGDEGANAIRDAVSGREGFKLDM